MTLQKALYMQDVAYSARLDRQFIGDIFVSGVRSLTDLAVSSAGSALQTSIARGVGYVTGTHNSDQGTYRCFNDAAVTLTHDAAVTNLRWDTIILRIYDSDENAGVGADQPAFEIIKGSENASASLTNKVGAPSLSGIVSYIKLADVLVPVGVGPVIPSANIDDERPLAGTPGLHVPLSVRSISEIGVLGQTRAGRILTPTDFTDLGLPVPIALWNLSDVNDSSGNARHLTNKGGVSFGTDILGLTGGAAVFSGSTGQALHRTDEAGLSIKTGAWGCWFRGAKRSTSQMLISKRGAAGQRSFFLNISASNVLNAGVSVDGTNEFIAVGSTDVCDDRWHFAIVTYEGGMLRIYLDGAAEPSGSVVTDGMIFDSTAPFNIGASAADAATAAVDPFYGRVDEAFLLGDIPSEDQVRCLMAFKLLHGSTRPPRRVNLNVRRRRKGVVLATTDFTALGLVSPLRLYNLAGTTMTAVGDDLGTDNQDLAATGFDIATLRDIAGAGPDGKSNGAAYYDGVDNYHSATDAGLPAGTAARTLLAWFKTGTMGVGQTIMRYGTEAARVWMYVRSSDNALVADDAVNTSAGPFAADGQWHLAAFVLDNAAADGKAKLYMDGRLVAGNTALSATTLGGAGFFRIGARSDGTNLFKGQIARVVVAGYAMTPDQIAAIYAKASQDLGLSPYNAGDYVERLDATGLYVLAERGTLEDQDQVELEVAA